MSYGFYRLGSNASPEDARRKFAQIVADAFAPLKDHLFGPGETVTRIAETSVPEVKPLEPPKVADTMPGDPRAIGYTGNTCDHCNSTRMMRSGHCETCADCGTTTGCS